MRRAAACTALALLAVSQPALAPAQAASGRTASPAVKVMALGDSITSGTGSWSGNGYRAALRTRLAAGGLRIDFVGSRSSGARGTDTDHEGHPGWKIAQIAARTDRWLTTYKPDVVLLHIGMNDLRYPANSPGAAKRLAALINQIRRTRPAAHIFVAKLSGSALPAVQARIAAYNASIAFIVKARGPRVHLVDQSTVRGPYLRDSVHPNDAGYAKMSNNWSSAIRKVLPTRW